MANIILLNMYQHYDILGLRSCILLVTFWGMGGSFVTESRKLSYFYVFGLM